MTDVTLMKGPGGMLIPADELATEFIRKLKQGYGIKAKISKVRNIGFHRKFFCLLTIGYEAWEAPQGEYAGIKVAKEFERFRKDVTILAGYYTPVYNLKGEVRLEPKSISFGNMEQEDFEKLYSAVADVLLRKVLTNYTRADLDRVVERIVGML